MPNLAVVGLQWGDEGKGKLVDYLADGHDSVVRFNGGSNAGHTVVIGDKKHTFHLIPSGAMKGKGLLIGAGVVLDPEVLKDELGLLPPGAREKLLVDRRASLVTPLDKELDKVLEEMRGADDVARKIVELRTSAGLSQRELAKLVGTTASVICRLEDADYEGHSLAMLRRIGTALKQRVEIRFVPVRSKLQPA